VHSEERNFSCRLCSLSYKYKKGLNRHYRKVHKKYYNEFIGSKLNKNKTSIEDFESSLHQITGENSKKLQPSKKIKKTIEIKIEEDSMEKNQPWNHEFEFKIITTSPFPTN
jgi:hypothetical protein